MNNLINENLSIENDDTAKVVAEVHGVTPDYVRKVKKGTQIPTTKKGKRKAKKIIESFDIYKEGKAALKTKITKIATA
jgi:hypothetical protein